MPQKLKIYIYHSLTNTIFCISIQTKKNGIFFWDPPPPKFLKINTNPMHKHRQNQYKNCKGAVSQYESINLKCIYLHRINFHIFIVDWAALAKQWIAQRETVAEHPPAMPIGGAPPPPPPPANGGPGGDDMDIEGDNENNSQDSNSYGNMPVYQNQGKFGCILTSL